MEKSKNCPYIVKKTEKRKFHTMDKFYELGDLTKWM